MLDRVLNKGAVVAGEVVISVAGIDLIYLALNVVVTSVGTARRSKLEAHSCEIQGRKTTSSMEQTELNR